MGRNVKHDTRGTPRYTPREAAHHLSVPSATVRAWSVGYLYHGADGDSRRFQPLITPAAKAPLTLSFWNMVELYVLASLRRRYAVPMPKVRAALRYTARELGAERPLLEGTFYTDGVELFVEKYATLINASDGQTAMRDVLKHSLKRVERGTDGRALRLYPWLLEPNEPRFVELDPERSFGRLVLAGTGVPTEIIAERFGAGDSISVLAADYRMPPDRIEQALRWEQCAPRAA
jgi:uncharacterized protein (DUF433 family)